MARSNEVVAVVVAARLLRATDLHPQQRKLAPVEAEVDITITRIKVAASATIPTRIQPVRVLLLPDVAEELAAAAAPRVNHASPRRTARRWKRKKQSERRLRWHLQERATEPERRIPTNSSLRARRISRLLQEVKL
jgi:hypothetical protein